mmetsp:Transcript_9911/g.14929  ORF Transcript_9911/g.14929 Transcript_9911/m.14929 type:complete len:546 (+) Transcript_9911:206-1843(+)
MQPSNYVPPATSPKSDFEAVEIDGGNDGQQQMSGISKPQKQSGLAGASANLVNSIVGAGIIGIPYALRESGLIAGLFLLLLVAWLTDKSLKIIVGLASFHPKLKNRDVSTFEDLASYPFGNFGSKFILLNMFVMAYGAMVAYLLIIKDTIPSVLGIENRFERTLIMIATSITIMLPLSMQRDMASLSFTSLISVLADVVLVGFITAYSPIKDTVEEAGGFVEVLKQDAVNPTLFIGLGILSTAMACQHSAFIVSGSLENKTMSRWSKVTGFSIGISAILCAILGVSGYLGFLEETEGDVLNNFQDSFAAHGARILLAITMFFTYPMESFVARHVLVQLFHNGDLDGRDLTPGGETDGKEAGGYFCFNRRQTWSFAIYLMALLPALIVDDLGPVLSITGSFGGGCIAYMAPGLCYLGVNGDAFLSFARGLVGNRGSSREGGTLTQADLPVAGSSNTIMTTDESNERKPVWWYLFGFPMWTKIAQIGSANMAVTLGSAAIKEAAAYDEDCMVPTRREFFIAIFFICFGVLSLVAGVGSNIYVQLTRE